ncbi:MAG: hypothetical protein CM15mP62_30880 [Rhodospirillaceae bacterium]|nr:MAG: hypothetical protein CM15mP62_30880 [Rhodospirillaceae bacterium]
MKHVFQKGPANSGVLEPVDFIKMKIRFLSVKPKTCWGYTETILRIIDLVFQALACSPELTNGWHMELLTPLIGRI